MRQPVELGMLVTTPQEHLGILTSIQTFPRTHNNPLLPPVLKCCSTQETPQRTEFINLEVHRCLPADKQENGELQSCGHLGGNRDPSETGTAEVLPTARGREEEFIPNRVQLLIVPPGRLPN